MDREFAGFQDAFGKKGLELCRQLLGKTQQEVLAKQREYGFSTGTNPDAVRDNVEELALAARELLPLQEGITAQEEKIASFERQMSDAEAQINDPRLDDSAKIAASETADRLRQLLMEERDSLGEAEKTFGTRKGELSGEFPILGVANVGAPDKQRMDAKILRNIAHGKLGDVSAKLDKTLSEIASVTGQIDEDSVWSVPQLRALTKQALGVTPRTFQDRAVESKLLDIQTGKVVTVVSKIAAAFLATILTFGAAGPMVFALDGAMFAQDAYDLAKSIKQYRFEQALAGTHYDQAKALSQDEPSTFWLAFEIVTTLVGVGDAARAAKGLSQARKVFSEVRAARKAVAAVQKAEDVATKLDEIAELAGSRGLSGEVQQRLKREALEELAQRADDVGETARRTLRGSDDFAAKAAELGEAVKQNAATLGGGKPVAEFKLEVLSKGEFEARFASKKGRAVFTMNDGKPTIFARFDARPADIADEAAHLVQLGDPKLVSDLKFLDEANLADWKQMSVADKLEFYQRKLNVEIDAKQRTLEKLTDPDELELARHNLEDLKALQADVASITPDQLMQMNAKTLKEPAFLDQPARAFGKDKAVVGGGQAPARPDLAQINPDAPAPRAVASHKKDADYSTAYNDKTVSNVQQHGDVWQERVIVTSGYSGKVKGINPGKNGSKVISIQTDGGGVHKYVVEAGAEIPDQIKKGAPIDKDAVLGREVPRDYRWVEVQYSDGKPPTTRAEIKSTKPGAGWIQRGKESGERGRAAETAAKKEADEALETAKEAGKISGAVHLPHRVGGGGFDDVIVEFVGTGEDIAARIRIREVKDYPNRHVPLDEFSALNENWAQNLKQLREDVEAALIGKPPRGYEKLDTDQLEAIQRKLNADDFEVEIRLGDSTKLGIPGKSHAATTLPALESRVGRKIDVKKIGEGDR